MKYKDVFWIKVFNKVMIVNDDTVVVFKNFKINQ
jgi:hypothetical protein